MKEKVTVRRSILWATGSKRSEYLKLGLELGADAIRLDLEDLVPPEEKDAARESTIEFLLNNDFGNAERMVRANNLFSPWGAKDLLEIPAGRPDVITLAKINSPQEMREADLLVAEGEEKAGLPVGSIELMPLLETAQSIVDAREIMAASPRVKSFNFGIQDLATDLGATPTVDGTELLYAKQSSLLAARSLGVMPIEGTSGMASDLEGFRRSTQAAKVMGFEGRSCIHPDQVTVANEVFTPDGKMIEEALQWRELYESQRETGSLYAFDDAGVIVGPPVLKRYERVLEMADALGLTETQK